MSFLRHEEIYRPMSSRESVRRNQIRGSPARTAPTLIGTMSFQLVIPWRVALPQSPPPLRQLGTIVQQKQRAVQSKSSERQVVS